MNQLPLQRRIVRQTLPNLMHVSVVCRTKPNLPNHTDSKAALLPYLTHQLGSVHELSGVWNGPKNSCTCEMLVCKFQALDYSRILI